MKTLSTMILPFLISGVLFGVFSLEQITVVNKRNYVMRDNGHREAHHFFRFRKRPPENNFVPYNPRFQGIWHVGLEILERPSTKTFRFCVLLNDHKWYGHRSLVKFNVRGAAGTYTKSRKGYGRSAKATPIDWSNPPGKVVILVATHWIWASVDTCGTDGKCWNIPYEEKEIWPYKVSISVTLVPPGAVYDDTGLPGGKPLMLDPRPQAFGRRFVPGIISRILPGGNVSLRIPMGMMTDASYFSVYDLSGRKVQSFPVHSVVHNEFITGIWNGQAAGGQAVAPGIYLAVCHLQGHSRDAGIPALRVYYPGR